MQGLVPPLLLVSLLLIFWLLVLRPGVRRERDRRAMQASLSVGDRIILTSGIFATVRALHDDRADIEIAPGTTITVALGAVGGLAPETTGPDLTKTDNEARATQTSTDPEES